MKKLSVLFMACALSVPVFADKPKPNTRFYTKCIGGYLYAVAETYEGGISIQQVLEKNSLVHAAVIEPIKCKEDE